jgi:hypothetical protein
VNSLPLYGTRQPEAGPRDPRGKGKAAQPRNTSKHGPRAAGAAECSYPNSIPLGRENRQTTGRPDKDEIEDPPEHLEEAEDNEEILARIHADNSEYFNGTANPLNG